MSDDYGPYERSGKGGKATEGELQNRFETYDLGNDPNPETTAAMKERMQRIEQEKADLGIESEDSSKGKGLIEKIKDKVRPGGSDKPTSTDDNELDAQVSGSSDVPSTTSERDPRVHGLPVDEHGYITLVKEGSHPDDPKAIITEK